MKEPATLKEYVRSLTDDELKGISTKLHQNLCGDLADVLDIFAQNKELDHYLASATTHEEFYDYLDLIKESMDREYGRRLKGN